ncbi:MAG: thioredoxin family protein [Bacillota bacterium]
MKTIKDIISYEQHVLKAGWSLVVFYSHWCRDCHYADTFMPRLETLYPQITFYLVDRGDIPELAKALNIYGVPSFVLYYNDKECTRYVNKNRKTFIDVQSFIETSLTKKGCL